MIPVLSSLELFTIPKPSAIAILRIHNRIIKTGRVVNAIICFRDLSKCGIDIANPNKNPGSKKIKAGCENELIKNVIIPDIRISPKVSNCFLIL